MILAFAALGALIAGVPFPGSSFLLLPMEVLLLYLIMRRYNAFEARAFAGAATVLAGASICLKSFALWLYDAGGLGYIADPLVAYVFILAFGRLAKHHYAAKAALRA